MYLLPFISQLQLGDGKVGNVTPVQELYKFRKPNSYKNIKILGLVMEAESADLQKFLMEKLVPTTFSPSP